jgi:hypothetical protein
LTGFDKEYCEKQYELYKNNRKNKEEFVIPSLTSPEKF